MMDNGAESHVDILGVNVSAIDLDDAVATIEGWIAQRSRQYVCVTGAHGVIECQSDERLRNIHNAAGMVTPDGMPLVWLARWLGAVGTSRVYGPDLMRLVSEVSARHGYKQFYYGGAPGVAEKLEQEFRRRHRTLDIAGTYCPPFRPLSAEEDDAIVAAINAAKADIVWVGTQHAQAGSLDGRAPRSRRRSRHDRSWRCVRLPCRRQATGSALDAAQRFGVAVSPSLRAATLVAPVRGDRTDLHPSQCATALDEVRRNPSASALKHSSNRITPALQSEPTTARSTISRLVHFACRQRSLSCLIK